MNFSLRYLSIFVISLGSTACFSLGEDNASPVVGASSVQERDANRNRSFAGSSSFDSVSLLRRPSGACPGAEGGAQWYARLSGTSPVRVTYGVRLNGEDDGSRDSLTLHPRYQTEREMMCTGDGRTLEWEPFVVDVEVLPG